jgi:hypothetical protein
MTDAQMLALWEQWKAQLRWTLDTTSQDISDKRHEKVMEIERKIGEAHAEGLKGLAIQLGLWHFNNSRIDVSDAGNALAISALASLIQLTGIDAKAEAEAVCPGAQGDADIIDIAEWRAKMSARKTP